MANKKSFGLMLWTGLCSLSLVACSSSPASSPSSEPSSIPSSSPDSSVSSEDVSSSPASTEVSSTSSATSSEDSSSASSSSSEESSSSSEESSSSSEAKIYCVVTFDLGYGDLSFTQQVEKYDKAVKPNDPVRNGYSFLGWKDENGDTWVFNGYSITKDITLYAQWSDPIDYSVRFINDDETLLYATTAHYGDVVTYDGPTPESAYKTLHYDYDFIGWDKPLTITGDVTLTAQYEVSYIPTTVYYLDYDGSVLESGLLQEGQEPSYTLDKPVRPDDPATKTQFEFAGWDKVGETSSEIRYQAHYLTCTQGLIIDGDTVIKYEGSATEVSIPKQWGDTTITKIADNAFYMNKAITSVTLPDTLESIGKYAFYGCSALASIPLPKNLSSIGQCAFVMNTALTAFVIDEDNAYFTARDGILYDKSMETLIACPVTKSGVVALPATLKAIGSYAFHSCKSITGVSINDGLTDIQDHAFYLCSNLGSIHLPASTKRIGEYAFGQCGKIASIYMEGVESIGDHAFFACSKLYTVSLPDTLSSIGVGAFRNCSSFYEVSVSTQSPYYSSSNGVLYDKDQKTLVLCPSGKNVASITLPSTVRDIAPYAVYQVATLKTIVFPDGLETIGDHAFESCSSLKTINCPTSLTSIGYSAFSSCEALTAVTIPGGVTSIGTDAFGGCSALTGVTMEEGVKDIGAMAFISCGKLATVNLPSTLESIGERAFEFDSSLTSIALPNGLLSIGKEAFESSGLQSLEIPASVTYIGQEAFMACKSMNPLTVSEDNQAYCSLNNVIYDKAIETAVVSIPSGNYGTKTLPNTLKHIGPGAYRGCNFSMVIIPEGAEDIGELAFYANTNLQSVVIPSSVNSIGDLSFFNCSSLSRVYYSGTETSWNDIDVQGNNTLLLSKARYYYCEQQPTEAGNYWHYVDGVPTVW